MEALQTSQRRRLCSAPTGSSRCSRGRSATESSDSRSGLSSAIGLAFLWEALDTRVRSAQEIGEKLGGLPLLARVPVPGKKLRSENKLVMLEDPSGVQAETFRMLRTNLDFVTLDRDVHTIMVTSAVEQEGKSTTIANLAVALARGGTARRARRPRSASPVPRQVLRASQVRA